MKSKHPPHAVTIEQRIGLHHCDPLNVAWHGRYFEWFEMARTALFVSIDLDVPRIREMGFRMYIVDAKCRYMAPMMYGDIAKITAWFVATAPLVRVAYDVHHGTSGRWSARASTVLATTDHAGALLPTTPNELLAQMPQR